MDRRQVLKTGIGLMAMYLLLQRRAFAQVIAKPKKPIIVLSRTDADPKLTIVDDHLGKDVPGSIVFFDLIENQVQTFSTPIWAHEYIQNPRNPSEFLGAAKWTPSAVVFDLTKKQVLNEIRAPKGFSFFGHACFSPFSSLVFLTAHSFSENRGCICVYDSTDWKFLKMVDTAGLYPHDCKISSQHELCVVSNLFNGKKDQAAVQFMDPRTFKIKKTIICKNGLTHITQLNDLNFIVSGGNLLEETRLIHLHREQGQKNSFELSKNYSGPKMFGEGLSLCALSESGVAVTVTDPTKQILIWNIHENSLVQLPVDPFPLGLVKYEGQLYYNHGKNGSLHRFKIQDLQDAKKIDLTKNNDFNFSTGNGRHMRLYDRS